jgi:hypothetical protein
MTTLFLQDVKSALNLNTFKVDSPLFIWNAAQGKLIYNGDANKTLIPMHKTRHDVYIKFIKYCK